MSYLIDLTSSQDSEECNIGGVLWDFGNDILDDSDSSITFGLQEYIETYFTNSSSKIVHLLATSPILFIQQTGHRCGYVNLQILLRCLLELPYYKSKIMSIPSIKKIQTIIEEAWSLGWDPTSCDHFNSSLVGTHSWIGATDVTTFLNYINIDARVKDFGNAAYNNGIRQSIFEVREDIINWIERYFRMYELKWSEFLVNNNQYFGRFIPPLYLQYMGHSVTIVGISEKGLSHEDTYIHIFDPTQTGAVLREAAVSAANRNDNNFNYAPFDLPNIAHSCRSFFQYAQYQIVYIHPGILLGEDYQAAKRGRNFDMNESLHIY